MSKKEYQQSEMADLDLESLAEETVPAGHKSGIVAVAGRQGVPELPLVWLWMALIFDHVARALWLTVAYRRGGKATSSMTRTPAPPITRSAPGWEARQLDRIHWAAPRRLRHGYRRAGRQTSYMARLPPIACSWGP